MSGQEGTLERLEERVKYVEILFAVTGTPRQDIQFTLGLASTERLLQMGLGIRKLVEGFDPDRNYSESEWSARYSGIISAQQYLRNVADAISGNTFFRQIFTQQSIDALKDVDPNYRNAALYNVKILSPIGTTLADVKPEERRQFKESLIRAVDFAYSMLQKHRYAQELQKN